MNVQGFVDWLIQEKKMKQRSAKDVVSRYGRVCRMLQKDSLDPQFLVQLEACNQYQQSSAFIKSQLKRAGSLYLEFLDLEKK